MPNFPIGWPRFLFQGREYDCTTSIGISGGMFSAIKLNRNENKLIEYSYMKVILFRLLAGFLFIIELIYMIFLDKELSSDGRLAMSCAFISSLSGIGAIILSIIIIFRCPSIGKIEIIIFLFLVIFSIFPSSKFIIDNKLYNKISYYKLNVYYKNINSIKKYISEKNEMPSTLLAGLKDTLTNRTHIINYRIIEPFSGKTNIVQEFDGTGGWVYNPEQGIFGLNVKGKEQYTTNFSEYLEKVKTDSPEK